MAGQHHDSDPAWRSPYENSISRLNGYDPDSTLYVPVVIIGAGESGIALGCKLREKLGFDQFRIYDRQGGIGGTWWINRYPGVACDVPAFFYSFSFAPNYRWSTFHPPGPEIVKYLNDVCSKYEITDKVQCNTDVEGCRWLEDKQIWEVYLRHMVPGTGDLSVKDRLAKIDAEGEASVFLKRETVHAKIVASAVGGLVEPNSWPRNVPGKDQFKGEIFHSARWRDDVDFNNKNVVVLGTGCSAAQFVPRLPKEPYNAKSVTQIMRSPPWVVPRISPPFGNRKWAKYSPIVFTWIPGLGRVFRTLIFLLAEYDFLMFKGDKRGEQFRKGVERDLIKHLKKTTPEKYHDILTPNYSVGCKRRIFDATWFPGLNDSKIDLTTKPLTSVQEHSVTLGPGQSYPEQGPSVASDVQEVPADVIVLANGFETARWLHPLKVVGRGGKDLVEEMDARGGPQAYLGTAMDGFPNFFLIFGPNTATGHSSVILASENMANYSLNFIKKVLNGDATTVEVKKEAEVAYTRDLQQQLKKMVWTMGGCSSWYTHGDWNGTVYPYTQIWFGLRCMFPVWSDWNIQYTRKGLIKKFTARILKYLGVTGLIVTAYYAKQSGDFFGYLRNLVAGYLPSRSSN